MKKRYLLLLIFFIVNSQSGEACDVCGGSINGLGKGFLTNSYTNLIGINWQHSIFENTPILENNLSDEFQYFEISVQYFLAERFRINFHQPYQRNVRHLDGTRLQSSGISDTRMMGSYIFIKNKTVLKNAQFFVDGGLGVKLPTGKYNPDIHDNNLPENFNAGNGSFGLLLSSNAILSCKNIGIAWQNSFQYLFKCNSKYHFGHQLSSQLTGFWEKAISSKIKIIPASGIRIERIGSDKHANGKTVHGTGGHGVYSIASLNLKSNKWLLNCSYLQPLSQKYGGGEIRTKGRFNCQLSFTF